MKKGQVAAQLYTIRQALENSRDIAKSLGKVRRIGYEAVQVSGLGPIEEDELVRMLAGEGLTCCATHESGEMILTQPEVLIDRLNKLNCKYVAYPHPGKTNLSTLPNVLEFAWQLDAAGAVLRQAGKVLTYHNHHVEFKRVEGELVLDVIYENTQPENLQAELDTYWVQYGGGCPAGWCQKLKSRLPVLHLKDYVVTAQGVPTYAEVGKGNLDWKSIISAAEQSGCEWYAVEQDECEGDPFDSLKQSFDYLSEQLCT